MLDLNLLTSIKDIVALKKKSSKVKHLAKVYYVLNLEWTCVNLISGRQLISLVCHYLHRRIHN